MQPDNRSEAPRSPKVLAGIERWRRKVEKYGRYPREYQSLGENGSAREEEEAIWSRQVLLCLEQSWRPHEWDEMLAILYVFWQDGYDAQRMYEAAAHRYLFIHEREAPPWSEVKAELEERRARREAERQRRGGGDEGR